ncbi:hypothetical protein BRD22_01435 [Halobacteriales archaeon SW_8_68_21]|nr:MAG: hypothetical protein BRD22_01435 [Halobacteriales archaeon SW_8_68_21]
MPDPNRRTDAARTRDARPAADVAPRPGGESGSLRGGPRTETERETLRSGDELPPPSVSLPLSGTFLNGAGTTLRV